MKQGCLIACALCVLFSSYTIAQVPVNQHPVEKPALFAQLPEKFSCSTTSLQNLFTPAANDKVNAQLGSQLKLTGIVLEKVAVSNNQLSINIRCNSLDNALLNISRITLDDGTYKYVGRMINPSHGDVLLLWEERGQYYFVKQKQLLSMVE
jgi:hypothetical protein